MARSRPPKSTRGEKIAWLLANPRKWEGWTQAWDPRRKELVEAMKDAGLVSKETYWCDINLNNLIQDARKIRRNNAKKLCPEN